MHMHTPPSFLMITIGTAHSLLDRSMMLARFISSSSFRTSFFNACGILWSSGKWGSDQLWRYCGCLSWVVDRYLAEAPLNVSVEHQSDVLHTLSPSVAL